MSHPAALSEAELLERCEVQRTRSSGPGGQHRNKVETAIRLTDRPTGVEASASERRSQDQNRQVAVGRLRVKLAVMVREPMDPGSEPSELWRGRVKDGKLAINPKHWDFPTLLAEALDRVAAYDYDVAAAAKAMGISTSQLIKLLKHERDALDLVNRQRAERGMKGYA
jgi:hypothetical protein